MEEYRTKMLFNNWYLYVCIIVDSKQVELNALGLKIPKPWESSNNGRFRAHGW